MEVLLSQENMPYGKGFSLFHWQHWCVLLLIAFGIGWCVRCYRSSTHPRYWHIGIALLLAALEIGKLLLLCITGQFQKWYLPFDLCGISIGFYLLYALHPTPRIGELLYSLSLPGTLMALFFPNWNKLPLWNFFCFHSFLFHALLALLPILLLSSGELRPTWKRLPFCFSVLAGCSLVVAQCNRLWGTNFFFLTSPSKNSPLVWFAVWFGDRWYWLGFFILISILWSLLYGGYVIFSHILQTYRITTKNDNTHCLSKFQ